MRNRILSGLSAGVIMMECSLASGSMSTVDHALAQGRDVFAWPNHPDSPAAEGAHHLLRDGARYFTTAEDILEDMKWQGVKPLTQEQKQSLPPLSPEQQRVYTELRRGELSLDELCAATGMEGAQLNATLTMLQLLGVVEPLPGKYFRTIC